MQTNKIWIIDINGCIIPSNFPNIKKEAQSENEIRDIIDQANNKGKYTYLHTEFIVFYRLCISEKDKLFFVTGRKESHFKDLTEEQLKEIKYNKIFYYPEELDHTEQLYLGFKEYRINKIIKDIKAESAIIIDDDTRYFKDINHNGLCIQIKTKKQWNFLSNSLFSKEKTINNLTKKIENTNKSLEHSHKESSNDYFTGKIVAYTEILEQLKE